MPLVLMGNLQKTLLKIPKGKVTTYKEIAKELGVPGAYRFVGTLLSKNPEPKKYPCYKVVKSNSAVGGYALGLGEKVEKLSADGVEIVNGKILNFDRVKFHF